ncbi:SGNH/GDSL hydrolase family protein [Arthrobacter agilis]|uniref:SGNH/GDSL hydrolase family protein n=1 Tax=Arthrobacter agilis TaxID=37921 RepID=UPI00278611D2|nr:SGNH/GDSL hydrolase family protein [Arthrobacter agilis]MDQ0736001.1 lysophospholipase L1-like esterase [Arthrobacter agilis]
MTPAPSPSGFRVLRLAVVALAASAMLGGAAGPAAAEPEVPLSYVALGDSYASGFGAGSYTGSCGRSPFGLPGLLDGEEQVELTADVTCAGARAATDPGGAVDLPEQLAEVVASGALSGETGLVSISAGGNDAGFGEAASACASQPAATCAEVIASKNTTALPALAADLDALYGEIRAAAPDATVLVTGYPHLFSPEFGNALIPLASQEAFNAGTDELNAVIQDRAAAHRFVFVDAVRAFEGHGLGSPAPWITLRAEATDNLHPTAEGYRDGYYSAVRNAVDLDRPRC